MHDHGPNRVDETEDQQEAQRNARLGLVLFGIYLVLYSTFVLLNTFAPERMEMQALAGVNLAIIFGFVLILAALALALIYGWLCRSRPRDHEQHPTGEPTT